MAAKNSSWLERLHTHTQHILMRAQQTGIIIVTAVKRSTFPL